MEDFFKKISTEAGTKNFRGLISSRQLWIIFIVYACMIAWDLYKGVTRIGFRDPLLLILPAGDHAIHSEPIIFFTVLIFRGFAVLFVGSLLFIALSYKNK